MDPKSHWERVYHSKLPTQVSWYQPHALRSLSLSRRVSPLSDGAIIDVGGGASTLIDDLLDAGYHDLTVLDLSATALAEARTRLGTRANQVRWIEADILEAPLPKAGYSVWHDRAGSSSSPRSRMTDQPVAADSRSIGIPPRPYMPNSGNHSAC
jgi:SAM-dependent methyltransferase